MGIDLFYAFGISLLAVYCYMTVWFVIAVAKSDNSVADIAWGPGFVLVAWLTLFLSGQHALYRPILVTTLVTIWGIRLAIHIYRRNRGRGEDPRYAKWRAEWGKNFFMRSYLQVFMLQGFLLLLIAMPIIIANTTGGPRLGGLDAIGLALWLLGAIFEVGGDAQLKRFLANPANKGKLMTSGLWAYTRHPNYFGEVTQWWGIWIISLSAPLGMFAVIGPLTISFLILAVSGIPMTEARYAGNAEFEAYKKRTSAFLPWFPR